MTKKYIIDELLVIGEYHINHCEDELFTFLIDQNTLIVVIMDGCSSGVESHFGVALAKKILHKICLEEDYKRFYQKGDNALLKKIITQRFFEELQFIKNRYLIPKEAFLFTFHLIVLDIHTQQCETLHTGDGVLVVNDAIFDFDEDNRPDYLGYYLENSFENWYNHHIKMLTFDTVSRLAISSDGIFSFKKWKKESAVFNIDFLEYFLLDNRHTLHQKLQELKSNYGIYNMDDLAIVQVNF